jgi:hypothetical protein
MLPEPSTANMHCVTPRLSRQWTHRCPSLTTGSGCSWRVQCARMAIPSLNCERCALVIARTHAPACACGCVCVCVYFCICACVLYVCLCTDESRIPEFRLRNVFIFCLHRVGAECAAPGAGRAGAGGGRPGDRGGSHGVIMMNFLPKICE